MQIRSLIIVVLILLPHALSAQEIPTHDRLPIDPQILAQHLVSYASLPGALFNRDIEVRFISDPSGVIHSAHIPVGGPPVAKEVVLSGLFNRLRGAPSVEGRKMGETLVSVTVRFERGDEEVRRVVINGEHYAFPPLQSVPLPQPPLPEGILRVEGTSTPPGVNAQALSMELNFAGLSYQQILEGEVTATFIVEPDGSHGKPIRVRSTIPDPDFTADVVAILGEAATTPGLAERLPVRSMLEVRVICRGKEGAGGSSEQGISVAQHAPIPVPDGHEVRMDTIDVVESRRRMSATDVATTEGMPKMAVLELATTEGISAESASDPEERVISSEERGSIVKVINRPASYDPIELSENLVYPQDLMDARIRGYVVINVGLDSAGTITALDIIDATDERFVEPALDAVRAIQYNPATLNGRGVESGLVISLEFGL